MDRTFRGLTAGIIASVPKYVWNLFDYYLLHLTNLRFIDWSGMLLMGHIPDSTMDFILASFYLFLWDGLLGIAFAHLLGKTTSRGYIIKGIMFSFAVAFIFRTLVLFYRIPVLSHSQTSLGMISNQLAGFLWGGLTGLILKWLDKANSFEKGFDK